MLIRYLFVLNKPGKLLILFPQNLSIVWLVLINSGPIKQNSQYIIGIKKKEKNF